MLVFVKITEMYGYAQLPFSMGVFLNIHMLGASDRALTHSPLLIMSSKDTKTISDCRFLWLKYESFFLIIL